MIETMSLTNLEKDEFGGSDMKIKIVSRTLIILSLMMQAPNSIASWPAMDSQGNDLPTLSPLVKKVSPAIVNVATRTTQRVHNPLLNDPFFRDFFNFPGQQFPQERQAQGAGSGVIIDAKKGIVITNHHVIDKADEIQLKLYDGRTLVAKLLGSDPEVDIAVLKIESKNLEEVKIADSDQIESGDFVMALGNPFGLSNTVTTGIVSAIGRSGLGIHSYENFIQTDASINPGNSGGALVNLNGELIGINTAIIGPAGGNIGIGFAIPTNMAMASVEQILEYGEVKRGQLGIMIQNLTPELRESFDLDDKIKGILVAQVNEDSSAEAAGLLTGDIIVKVDDKPVTTSSQLRNEIGLRRKGDEVTLEILRDGKSKIIEAKIGKGPVAGSFLKAKNNWRKKLDGVQLADTNNNTGVRVMQITPGSAAVNSGLQQGDLIVEANKRKVKTIDNLKEVLAEVDANLLLRVERGEGAFFLVIQ